MPTINIIGAIGAGKTTLTEKLAQHTNIPVGYEGQSRSLNDETRELLQEYYQDRTKYALKKNLFFLQNRLETIYKNQEKNVFISDRFLYDDLLMTKINYLNNELSKNDWAAYNQVFNKVETILKESHPLTDDILLYVRPSFETTLSQIKTRGRKEEQWSDDPDLKEYYKAVFDAYDEFYDNWHDSPKLLIADAGIININSLIKNIKEIQPSFKNHLK